MKKRVGAIEPVLKPLNLRIREQHQYTALFLIGIAASGAQPDRTGQRRAALAWRQVHLEDDIKPSVWWIQR